MTRFGSIEAGGTKFVLAIGDENFKILEAEQIPTTTPAETIARTVDYFKSHPVDALAIGSFGPIDINQDSLTYGYVTTTPKSGWANTDLLGKIQSALQIPVAFTTDVNSSAFGESIVTGKDCLVYFTIGTGIGGGALQNGQFIGGVSHAEMGHQLIKRHAADLDFPGVCPFHGDCLEGVAAGPSLEARTGIRGEDLPLDHEVWDIQAYYIAQAAVNATLTHAPGRIILGGGVMAQEHMMARVRKQFVDLLSGYVQMPCSIEDYLVRPAVSNNGSATIGNFALAAQKLL
ncbi:MAG: ROK family protein [Streptococcaceae bacterium]|jgi:fructokinase|nr:ROK family protein [Streptococcaceae bacterium]